MKNQQFLLIVLIAAWAYRLGAQGYSQNLVQNGSFEMNYSYSGWMLSAGTLVNLGGPGAGVQCADGYNAVGLSWQAVLSQDVSTIVGQRYDFSFYLADWGPASVPADVVSLISSFDATPLGTATFNGTGHTYQNMGWQRFDYTVIATSPTSRISFFNPAAVNSGTGWSMIDNIGLVSVPEPNACELLLLSGTIAFLTCQRTFVLYSMPRLRSVSMLNVSDAARVSTGL